MTQYKWVMKILSDPLKFPEEIFSDLKKMEFESKTKGFFDRLFPIIINRVISKEGSCNTSGVRRLFISKEYETQWKEDLEIENRQKEKNVS